MKSIDDINNEILSIINNIRNERQKEENKDVNLLPKELRFLYKTSIFQINELLSLCKDDYRQTVTILITKKSPDKIAGYKFIDKFKKRPFIFINLLANHPKSKVRVKGNIKYAAIKMLKKNKKAFDLARKIHNKLRG